MISKRQWNNLTYSQRSAVSNLIWTNGAESKRMITSRKFHHRYDYILISTVYDKRKHRLIDISENVGKWIKEMLSHCTFNGGYLEVVAHEKTWTVPINGDLEVDGKLVGRDVKSIRRYVTKTRKS